MGWGQFDTLGVYHIGNEIIYNDKGKMSELTLYDKDKKMITVNFVNYEFDQKGNWIKTIARDEKGNVIMEERTYSYFE